MNNLTVVGPLPPPLSGTPVSFAVFCDVAKNSQLIDQLHIVDSSPKYLKQARKVSLSIANIQQALAIVARYVRVIRQTKSVLVFGSVGYVISMAPVLLILAKVFRRPFYFRSFGGVLDEYIRNLNPMLQVLAKWCLRNCDGVIVETELLKTELQSLLGGTNLHYVPGYRSMPSIETAVQPTVTDRNKVRMVFVGIIKAQKGVFDLLNALVICQKNGVTNIECTFYGSVHAPDGEKFNQEISQISCANYGGELDWQDVIPTLRHYDMLILPTYYEGEGHPGVLIEAMMAGIAIIASDFRSIPEIIVSEHNGLLFKPRDTTALAAAITRLAEDQTLLATLAQNNGKEARKYDANQLIANILEVTTRYRSDTSRC